MSQYARHLCRNYGDKYLQLEGEQYYYENQKINKTRISGKIYQIIGRN